MHKTLQLILQQFGFILTEIMYLCDSLKRHTIQLAKNIWIHLPHSIEKRF